MIRHWILIIAWWVVYSGVLFPWSGFLSAGQGQNEFQYDARAERLFLQALTHYEQGEYLYARGLFDSLLRFPFVHQRTTASYLMGANSLFALKKYDSSIVLIKALQTLYPATGYLNESRYTLSTDYMMLHSPSMAAEQLIEILHASSDPTLREKAELLLHYLVEERLGYDDLLFLMGRIQNVEVQDMIAITLIERSRSSGDDGKAESLLRARLSVDNGSKYRSKLLGMQAEHPSQFHYRVGVMLPLMSDGSQNNLHRLSGEILDGIDYALQEFTRSADPSMAITIDVRDIGMDSSLIVPTLQGWSQIPDMLCVIGPLFSALVADAAPSANRYRLPLVTPTATSTGLTLSGSYVFQMSPDYRTRGEALARYAVREMGYKKFIALATTEPMGKSSDYFSEEVKKLGGQVLANEVFSAGVTTIKEQCLRIRQAVFGVTDTAENFDVPVIVDAMYLAIDDPEEIGVIVSQLAFFNIKGAILGNNEWYDQAHLDAQRKLVDGVCFVSDLFDEDQNPALAAFRTAFKSKTEKTPSKYTFIGYDVMNLILSQLPKAKIDREQFRLRLNSVRAFHGLHSNITFSSERVNTHLFLLRYHRGVIDKVAEIESP